MKYVLSLLLGLLLGVALATAGLYFNPLTRGESSRDPGGALVFDYALERSGALLATHGKTLGLPLVPAEAPLLWESGIKGSLLAALPLATRGDGGRAVATRISVPSRAELLLSGVLVDDYWLISVPGRGSLFVHATSNQWPLLRDTVVQVDWLGRDWTEPESYRPTRGPSSGAALVVGLTGEFAGARGRGLERLTLARYGGSLDGLEGELALDIQASR